MCLSEWASDSSISVVIPVYNHARYIGDAIHSVLNQTYQNFEIIVVDDGSLDNCREVSARFGDRIRYIWQENKGLGGARNTGILASKGNLIGLLDADDQWQPQYLETMVSLAEQNPEAAVYYCAAKGMDADGQFVPRMFSESTVKPEDMYQTLLRANFLIPSTILMRRSVVMEAGLFEQTDRAIHGCEDWDLWLRIAPCHTFVGTSACLVRYRLHDNTFSARSDRMNTAVRAVIEKHFGPDDKPGQAWSLEKRRAYAGVYRYSLLTSMQRQNDWLAGGRYLRQALQIDPSLATDLDLFYELALGYQPSGHESGPSSTSLQETASRIDLLLADAFAPPTISDLEIIRRKTYGTAYYALGLAAYNAGHLSLSRRYLFQAVRFQPVLARDHRLCGNAVKSLFGQDLLAWMKRRRLRFWNGGGSVRLHPSSQDSLSRVNTERE